MCHVSRVTCHVSGVTCHVSPVTRNIYIFFLKKNVLSGGPTRWRVCYQRGLPRLVWNYFNSGRLLQEKLRYFINIPIKDISPLLAHCVTYRRQSLCLLLVWNESHNLVTQICNGYEPFACFLCDKNVSLFNSLKTQQSNHTGNTITCFQCDNFF